MESLLSLSLPGALWCAVVVFAASYVRGFSGFGFTAILVTGLTTQLPIVQIVPLSIALEIAASTWQASGIMRDVDWRKLGILLITGLLGTPLGIFLLGAFPDQVLRVLVLLFIFASSGYLVLSDRSSARFTAMTYAVAGFTIGVVNGATALSGLMLALFFSLSSDQPTQIRATIIAYLFVADVWAGGILVSSGFYEATTMARIVVALPILGLGVWLGTRHFGLATPERFKSFTLWLLLALSTTSLGILAVQALAG